MAAPVFGVSSLYDEEEMSLLKHVMKGQWTVILGHYSRDPTAHLKKVTWLGDTALHVAVAEGLEGIVKLLLQEILETAKKKHDRDPGSEEKRWFLDVLSAKNKDGNTPLHIAASIGSAVMCKEIAQHDTSLVRVRNNDGETPLFLAAHRGLTDAFLCLVSTCGAVADFSCCCRSDGRTVLHSAIFGEYFHLAFQIIHLFPELVERINEERVTPLKILARKPEAFKSGSKIGGWNWETLVYNCISVDPLEEATSYSINKVVRSPDDNHETENQFIWSTCFRFLRNIVAQACGHSKPDPEAPKEHDTGKQSASGGTQRPLWSKLVKHIHMLMLVVLGMGYARVSRLTQLKEKHAWSVQVMNKLIKRSPNMYAFDKGEGGEISSMARTSVPNPESEIPNLSISSCSSDESESEESTKVKKETAILIAARNGIVEMLRAILCNFPVTVKSESEESTSTDKPSSINAMKLETAMLIAARNGITEMAEAILHEFPVAVNDVDAEKKNIVLLAVETRQLKLYKMLLNYYSPYSESSTLGPGSPLQVSDHAFRMVDIKGNSALHLAARRKTNHKPWRIPGAALQMQWDIEWHKFVEKSMPPNFFVRYNKKGETPGEVFTESHKELVKEGGEWLTKTSESCSVVAALIATVAFATSTAVPGGTNDINGKPTLENQFAFKMFGITSLVSLSFSVTSLSMFLSILTSRYQEKDFGRSLPWKLLLGLTSLFVSIASVLISFCSGHFFVLGDTLKYAAFPVYALTCLPISFFAAAQFPLYFDIIRATFGSPFGGSSTRVKEPKKLIQVEKVSSAKE